MRKNAAFLGRPVQSDHIEDVIVRSIAREETAFRQYLKIYEMSNPRPSFGWYVKISAIAMIALMLVAALSLAASFSLGISAFTSLNQFLKGVLPDQVILLIAGVEAFAAVLGIEGFIVTTGMKSGLTKKEEDLTSARAFAAYILLAVSCVAGLFQNSSMLASPETVTAIEWVLMVVTGVGIPIAIMFAAPYLGLMFNFQAVQNEAWLAKARTQFENSKERKLARRDLIAEGAVHPRGEEGHPQPQIEMPRVADIVAWFRREFNKAEGEQLSAAEIARSYYEAEKITPVNGDMGRLAGAIRTYLSRERNHNGIYRNHNH
jgi:hypothetical protein